MAQQSEKSKDEEKSLIRLVLDVLKPHEPSIIELANLLSKVKGVEKVHLLIVEVDAETETTKITIEGHGFRYNDVKRTIERYGAAIRSIDEVMVGKGG